MGVSYTALRESARRRYINIFHNISSIGSFIIRYEFALCSQAIKALLQGLASYDLD